MVEVRESWRRREVEGWKKSVMGGGKVRGCGAGKKGREGECDGLRRVSVMEGKRGGDTRCKSLQNQ